jgi:hypothetical protein
MHCHVATRPEHTGHLGESPLWVGNVHEHSLGADTIEGAVGEGQGLRITNLEFYRKVKTSGAAE